jgi:hypothetical protein
MLTHTLDLVKGSWRYAAGLRGFLAAEVDFEDAKRILTQQLNDREETFLRVLELGVYANPRSPYRRLLLHAGFELPDVRALVSAAGLDEALSRLYDAGVYVTLDEFKGRAPVRRPGLEFGVSDRDFDNPLLGSHYEGNTGGTRSGGNRVPLDFDFLAHEAAAFQSHLHAAGTADRTPVVGLAAPPSAQGLSNLFQLARGGHMPEAWFSPSKLSWNRQGIQGRALTAYTRAAGRLFGHAIPRPVYLQDGDVTPMLHHLAARVRQGRPAAVLCVSGQAVRICLAAERAHADISGTAFFIGGEPYTPGKAAVLERVGAQGIARYGMTEIGHLSMGCGSPSEADDMHLLSDKVAMLQRPKQLASGPEVQALYYTSLLTCAPKLMLNVDSGDYATVEQRDCGCLWQQLGYTTHIRGVRSYEKLTSEGVMFMGSMLYELLEEVLPARFGGSATDYQLVEEEENGQPRVSLLISPRIGAVDEDAVVDALVKSLSFADWSRRMTETWQSAGTLRIQRQEPHWTAVGKILPLHVMPTPRVEDTAVRQ